MPIHNSCLGKALQDSDTTHLCKIFLQATQIEDNNKKLLLNNHALLEVPINDFEHKLKTAWIFSI